MRDAGIEPSSGSVPWPENEIDSFARQVNVEAGVSTIAVGALFPTAIGIGDETVCAVWLSVTRRRAV
jgi:hypothetical protein